MFAELQTLLKRHGFILAPEKVQTQPPIPIWAFKFNPLSFSFRGCSWIASTCGSSMTGRDYWEMFCAFLPSFPFLWALLSPFMTWSLGTLPLLPPGSWLQGQKKPYMACLILLSKPISTSSIIALLFVSWSFLLNFHLLEFFGEQDPFINYIYLLPLRR